MTTFWKPAALVALVATLALATTSAAHTLEVSRAAKANKTFAKLLCASLNEESPGTCVASSPGSCHQISDHRVRCEFSLTLNEEDGSQDRCVNLLEWSIRGQSSRLYPHYLGIRTCTVLKPPTSKEPAP